MLFNCYTVQLSNCSSVQLFKSPTVQESNCLTVKLYFEIKTSQDWDFFISTQNLVIFFCGKRKHVKCLYMRSETVKFEIFLCQPKIWWFFFFFCGKRKAVKCLYRVEISQDRGFLMSTQNLVIFLREKEGCQMPL